MLGEGGDALAAGAFGGADDERDVEGLGGEARLSEHPVVAQHLAVVGGDDDERAVQQVAAGQGLEHAADGVVDLGDEAEIDGAQAGEGGGVEGGGGPGPRGPGSAGGGVGGGGGG